MNKKTFLFIRLLTAMVLAALVSFSINIGNYILPLVAIATSIILFYVLKKKVKGVIADERDYKIGGKAARMTITIYCLVMAIIGVVMMSMAKSNPSLSIPAQIIAYSACALLLIYSLLFKIYSLYDNDEK